MACEIASYVEKQNATLKSDSQRSARHDTHTGGGAAARALEIVASRVRIVLKPVLLCRYYRYYQRYIHTYIHIYIYIYRKLKPPESVCPWPQTRLEEISIPEER